MQENTQNNFIEDTFNNFLENAMIEKCAPGVYLIYSSNLKQQGKWFEYHRKQKRIVGGCGWPCMPMDEDQIQDIDNAFEEAFQKLLKEKSDARASLWAESIDYEEVYGLDNGWN
jgi:hypothetical protein